MSERVFEFSEGTSNKFWAISVSGAEHTVRFGKIGTNGQSKTKTFSSDANAQADADKLIDEKTGKGYKEVTSNAAPASPPTPAPAATAAPAPVAKPTKAKKAKAEVTAAPVVTELTISPYDQLFVTYKPRPTFVPKVRKPFDLSACVQRLPEFLPEDSDYVNFYPLNLPADVSVQEARFWMDCMMRAHDGTKRKALLKQLGSWDSSSFTDMDRIYAAYDYSTYNSMTHAIQTAANALLTPESFLEYLRSKKEMPRCSICFGMTNDSFADAVRVHVLPYMTDSQIEEARKLLRPLVNVKNWDNDIDKPASPAFYLAAVLGMHDEMEKVLATMTPAMMEDQFLAAKKPSILVFGLGSQARVVEETERLKVFPFETWSALAWLAHTGTTQLSRLTECIKKARNKYEVGLLFPVLAEQQVPEIAPQMLELQLGSKASKDAQKWLTKNEGAAVVGLLPLTAGKGNLATAAKEYLKTLHAQGKKALFAAAPESPAKQAFLTEVGGAAAPVPAASAPTPTAARASAAPAKPKADSLPSDLLTSLAAAKVAKFPEWFVFSLLPKLTVSEIPLAEEQVKAILSVIKEEGLSTSPRLVKLVRQYVDPSERATFVWALFEMWERAVFPSKDKWAFWTLGVLGTDASAIKITPPIREWPGQSQHQRAVLGLEVLRTIGTDTALMQLNGIAQKLKFQGLKTKAQEMMEAIAKDRGMTKAELEDRIVPDLDLDEKGGRTLDFGPRQFRVVLTADLSPAVKEMDGKVRSELPKPGAKDDAKKGAEAVEAWKLLKKQLKEVLKIQGPRLEQAMVLGRRWKLDDFETLLVKHPLMTNLVQRLIWAAFDANGAVLRTFRVTDDKKYADAKDNPVTISDAATVGIVHPLNLTEADTQAWGQVTGDYELVPPFPQLSRPTFKVEDSQKGKKELTHIAKVNLHPGTIWSGTEKLGWERGSSSDHGVVQEFGKSFGFADVTAIMTVEPGIARGTLDMLGDQQIESVFFVKGRYTALAYPYHKDEHKLKLETIHPIAFSEIMADLQFFASKETT